jgi:hypothetical protein
MGKKGMLRSFLGGKSEGKSHLKEVVIHGRIIVI